MQNNTANSGGNWKRNVLIALCAFLALVFILLAVGTVYVHSLLGQLNRVDPDDDHTLSASDAEDFTDPGMETIDPSDEETLPNIDEVIIGTEPFIPEKHDPRIINILLVGQDRRPGEGRQRSDSMMMVTFNTKKNTITLTSLMRDSYVQIPGYKNNKLNAAYAFGGFKLLNKTLKINFGIFVDGNVEVDFNGFKEIIDYLGGVEIKLTQKEADYLNENYGFKLSAGTQVLNGAQALGYSRIRKIDTDYRRTERQRTVLISLLNRYKDKPVSEMLAILNHILPKITTDMSNGEILGLAGQLLPMLSTAQVNTFQIPVNGTFKQGNAQVRPGFKAWFQYDIDFAANRKAVQKLLSVD